LSALLARSVQLVLSLLAKAQRAASPSQLEAERARHHSARSHSAQDWSDRSHSAQDWSAVHRQPAGSAACPKALRAA